jgi:formate-dependent nitrite reductase membrane component NrfD
MIDERRLDELREEAARTGSVAGALLRYYDVPLLKAPVWTWEVPAYFFVGGAAGVAAVLAAAARATGAQEALIKDARWIAAGGAALSAPLLIADLGRPERFLNMMRVFKPQSPMSVGAWILAAFGTLSAATALADLLRFPRIANVAGVASAATGLGMATYTGVLLGATAIPAWAEHVSLLPFHFGASALSSAVSLLQLRGHDDRALTMLAIGAAVFETAAAVRAKSPVMKAAELLSGPVPLALRLLGTRSKRARRAAAAASLLGSLLTRLAWVEEGRESARHSRP